MTGEIRFDEEVSRAEMAAYLHHFADRIEAGDRLIIVAGDDSRSIHPPETFDFGLSTETESTWLGGDRSESVVLELGWDIREPDENVEMNILPAPSRLRTGASRRAREIREEHLTDSTEADEEEAAVDEPEGERERAEVGETGSGETEPGETERREADARERRESPEGE